MGERKQVPTLDEACPVWHALHQEIEVPGMRLADKDVIVAVHNARIRHLLACDQCKRKWKETGGSEVTVDDLVHL